MLQIKDRHFLKKKALIELKNRIENHFNINEELIFSKNSRLEMLKTESEMILYFIDDEATLIETSNILFPTVNALLSKKILLPEVIIDKGAIKFIINGADVMVPGIVDTSESIEKGDIICIVDVEFKKTLAIGKSLMSSKEIKEKNKGKAVQNLHHVGDKIWNTIKKMKD